MATLGALAAITGELEVEVKGNAALVKSQGEEIDKILAKTEGSGITHHYRQTTSHIDVVEVESDDRNASQSHLEDKIKSEKTKKGACCCFGGLRMKKK